MNTDPVGMPPSESRSQPGPAQSACGHWIVKRLRQAFLLGLVLAVIGATVGYFWVGATYRSIGYVHIPKRHVDSLTGTTTFLQDYDSYVESRAQLLRNQRSIELAMLSTEWKNATGPAHDSVAELSRFAEHLTVTHPAGTELIQVTFVDRDPKVAAVAVHLILQAYARGSSGIEVDGDARSLAFLNQRLTILTGSAKDLKDRIGAIGQQYGTDDLERIYSPKLERLNELQNSLKDAQIALAEAKSRLDSGVGLGQDPSTRPDPALSAALRADLRDAEVKVQKLAPLRDEANAEVLDIGRKELQIKSLQGELRTVQANMDETKERIDKINFNIPVQRDAVSISGGDVPIRPEAGRMGAVLGGAGAGAGLGVVCVVILAVIGKGKKTA